VKRVLLALACACLFGLSGPVLADGPPEIQVDAGVILRDVPPALFGANYGTLNMLTPDVFPLVQGSGVTWWRFPGGAVADQGPLQRSTIDLYVTQARMFGAEMMIQARLEGGTPQAAADLVRMVNIDRGYGVRMWGIGNEADLYDGYTAERAAREWRDIALAMLAVDPDIVLVGPETSQFTGVPGQHERAHEFLRVFLEMNADLVDIVAVHRYPFPDNGQGIPADVASLRADAPRWTEIAANLRAVADAYVGPDVPIAITEVSSHWSAGIGGEATPDSHYNAIWWADVLGRLMTGGVDRVAYFGLQTNDGLSGHGLFARYDPRPTYFTYALYAQFGSRLVQAETSEDGVRAYAALRDDGALTVLLVNMGDEAIVRRLALDDFEAGAVTASRFGEADSAPDTADGTDFLTDAGGSLPPRSLTLLTIMPADAS
jgi:hypothetical protein